MTQKQYRRLTRILFLFLFLLFVLLYLLLSRSGGASPRSQGGGWGNRSKELGTIVLSEVRSGGFILDELPIPNATGTNAPDFAENTVACRAELYNEGDTAVRVVMTIHGTDLKDEKSRNPGLCCGYYYYSGDMDPVGEAGYAALISAAAVDREKNLTLYANGDEYPLEFYLESGECRQLVLFLWADESVLPVVTDPDRDAYSVTVKLLSRGV